MLQFCQGRLSLVMISFYVVPLLLSHVACRNLPWQGLNKVSFFGLHASFEADVNYKNTNLNGDGHISIWDSHIMEEVKYD